MHHSAEKTPPCDLLSSQQQLFAQDYAHFFSEGHSKPASIGQPFLLHNPQAKVGVLLVHGLMAAPEEVRPLAEFLFAQGYSVYAPRMVGHGTSAEDLAQRTHPEWIESVQQGHDILKPFCTNIIAVGFSTGAAVLLQLVIKKPTQFCALISISAPLKFSKFTTNLAKPLHRINQVLNAIGLGAFSKPFATNHADNPHINYSRCPINSIVEIQHLMKQVKPNLARITLPCLIIHARHDPKVHVQSARHLYATIRSHHKRYHEIDFNQHGIIRGAISQPVFAAIHGFLSQLTQRQPSLSE